jgi:hypothetical protein
VLTLSFFIIIKASSNPSAKQVLTTLQKEHPTWKLPERRVTKFVKKQVKTNKKEAKGDSVTHEDEGSVASQASITKRMAQSTKKRLGSVLKRKKKSKGKDKDSMTPEKKPPSHIQTNTNVTPETIVSPISSAGGEEKEKEVETTPKVQEKEEDAPMDPRDLSVVYEDDNDGSKERQCCGGLCACAIM